jgi:two-component system, OmpR family, phosphate regulon sensor histidine kinase PhoR
LNFHRSVDTLRRVKNSLFRKLKAAGLAFLRLSWRHRDYWLRVSLAWGLGVAMMAFDRDINLDFRFDLRGSQSLSPEVVVVDIPAADWLGLGRQEVQELQNIKDYAQISDSAFWDQDRWQGLLTRILGQNPRGVAIALHFPENPDQWQSAGHNTVFKDPRVIWSTATDTDGRLLSSRFSNVYGKNSGLLDFKPDRDGSLRRTRLYADGTPSLAVRLAQVGGADDILPRSGLPESFRLINYRFLAGKSPKVHFSSVHNANLRDKFVVIGVSGASGQEFLTPVGRLSRAEITATVADNILEHRWVKMPPLVLMSLLLLFLAILTAWITTHYPQVLSSTIILTLGLVSLAATLSLFDELQIFIPLGPLLVTGFSAYIVFTSFQLTISAYQNMQLEKEKALLLDVEELKSNFLSLISHDLKTPIAKIQGICDRIGAQGQSDHPQDGPLQDDVRALQRETAELNRYIKTLIQVSRIAAHSVELRMESMDLNDTIEAVVEQLAPLAHGKQVILELDLEPMFLIEGDQLLIHEVVMNLVENAVKFSPNGGKVTLRSRDIDDRVLFMVEDRGPGIPKSEQGQIFEKFYRGEKGREHAKGSGLGLYLVKYFIERHDGRVILDSEVGLGTRIGFSLPTRAKVAETSTKEDEVAYGKPIEHSYS